MAYSAKILKDNLNILDDKEYRLTTFEVTIPRIVLSEFNTHRVFSRNSASSRAIPIEKRITQVESDPFIPDSFGKNRAGMQSSEELSDVEAEKARSVWLHARDHAVEQARELAKLGVHKQLANRLIEPFCWQTIIISATEYDNWYALRAHGLAAQKQIQIPAQMMFEEMKKSTPTLLKEYEWHLPLIQQDEKIVDDYSCQFGIAISDAKKISVGRCARISYLTHDGKRDIKADIDLCDKLYNDGHMSPFEHVARPMTKFDIDRFNLNKYDPFLGNFKGWVQYRKEIPNEHNFALRSSNCVK